MSDEIYNKKLGAAIGLAIGDALGGPYEFFNPGYTVLKEYKRGGYFSLEKGEYTDDTSMSLCLAQSLIDSNGFEPVDQMNKYLMWLNEGYMSSRDHCFDIGSTTERSLNRFAVSKNPYTSDKRPGKHGNAPIMRLAPIPIFYFDKKESLIEYARLSSKTTHHSSISADCAVLFAQLISNSIKGLDKEDLHKDIDFSTLDKQVLERFNRSREDILAVPPKGFILDTLEVALYGFYHYDNYIDGLLYVISLGYDADTVGAIYGQIAGSYYGFDSIPKYYKENLIDFDKIFKIYNELIEISS